MRFALVFLAAAAAMAAELPKALIIGDSISIGYAPYVTKLLRAKAEVSHHEGNAAHTNNGVEKLDSWLGATKWSVITFNFGLHDLKIMEDGKHQVEVDVYEKNLATIALRVRKTGAQVVYVTTTPVPDGKLNPLRKPGDELDYNAAALRVMKQHQIPVADLHTFAKARLAEIQTPANVHFTPAGYAALAEVVAKAIEERIKQ